MGKSAGLGTPGDSSVTDGTPPSGTPRCKALQPLARASLGFLLLSCASPKVHILKHPAPGSPMAGRETITPSPAR